MSRDRQIPLDQAFIPGKTLVYGEGNTVWNGGNGPDVITDSNNVVWVDVSTNSSAVIVGTDNNCVRSSYGYEYTK